MDSEIWIWNPKKQSWSQQGWTQNVKGCNWIMQSILFHTLSLQIHKTKSCKERVLLIKLIKVYINISFTSKRFELGTKWDEIKKTTEYLV